MASHHQVCQHFLRGQCRYGDACKFAHPQADVCQYFLKGNCRFGDNCRNAHPTGQQGRGPGAFSRPKHQGIPGTFPNTSEVRNPYQLFTSYNQRSESSFGSQRDRGTNQGGVRSLFPNQTSNFKNGNQSRGFIRNGAQWQNFRDKSENASQAQEKSNRQVHFNSSNHVRLYNSQTGSFHDYRKDNSQGIFPFNKTDHQESTPSSTVPCSPSEVKSLVESDMREWEASKIWPLSSYSYAMKTRTLPGFEDVSMEELRWEAYQASKEGQLQRYITTLEVLLSAATNVKLRYANMTPDDARALMISIQSQTSDTGPQGITATTNKSRSVFGGWGQQATPSTSAKYTQSSALPSYGSTMAPAPSGVSRSSASTVTAPFGTTQVLNKPITASVGSTSSEELAKKYSIPLEAIKAFQSNEFQQGEIPICAPPVELIT